MQFIEGHEAGAHSIQVSGDPFYSSKPWRKLRAFVLARDGYTCQVRSAVCTFEATAVDHRVPISLGGEPLNPANCRATCQPCNSSRVSTTKIAAGGVSPSREW